MSEPGHYPPPDFSSPPPNTFQPQQPRCSSFHPGMWSWQETPTETSWGHSSNYYSASANYGSQSAWGSFGAGVQQGQSYEHHWHRGGGRGGRPQYGNYPKHKNNEQEFSYFCDTCDRGFKNTDKYNEHISQHVKCSVSDCTFMAHEKIVSIHWKNNHAPGAKRIKLDTPEEIAKWREERRKNYPTRENVEKKKKLIDMREETGSVLETAQFGRMRGRGRGRGWRRGRGWGNRGFQDHHRGAFNTSDVNAAEKLLTPVKLNKEGDPLGALVCGGHDSDKDEATSEKVVVAPKQISSALGYLMANYGSASESEEEPDSTPIQKAQELLQENRTMNTTASSPQNIVPVTKSAEVVNNRTQGRGKRGRRHQETERKRGPTLLEMLLAPDIRHERNVLLQCVRYVVRNNFFGLENKSLEENKKISSLENETSSETADSLITTGVNDLISQNQTTDSSTPLIQSYSPKTFEVSLNTDMSTSMDSEPGRKSFYDDDIWDSDSK